MKRLIFLGLIILAFAGCATNAPSGNLGTLKQSDFRSLRPGVTTKADVAKSLGTPFAMTSYARQQEEVWDYRYIDLATIMHVAVIFDGKGIFKYFTEERDPAYYSGMAG
jgi:outer membrane protein assembly factor BamE (lipoprotein component of BamABCDE complex)